MAEKEGEEPVCKIEVRGYKVATEDEVEIYFKNTLGYGDTIVEFDPVNTDGVIFITFTSKEVARRVAEHQHVVNGCTLDVKLYEPPKHKSAKHLSRTIEVRGVTKSFDRNTLHLFFENEKRSGGDEIEMLEYQEENEIALITYKNEEVAQRVASLEQHEVDTQRFEVKMYSPKPTYEDRVLLSGLTSKVTRDGLTNYLEAKVGQLPTNFLYSEEEEKLIITFNKNIDFQKLKEACKKQPLEGSHLQPSRVHVSNCIMVLNLDVTTTDYLIQLYFETEKRSGGGPVEKVEFNRQEKYCLVYFKGHTICERVLQRKHEIGGTELQVSLYYDCLGCISEDFTGLSFKLPMPIKLEGLEFAKMQFLIKSNTNKTALEKQLQDCFTQIQWPQTETDCTILTCTLTSDVQDCKKKALTWAKQAEQNLNDFLKVILVHNLDVCQEIFEIVLQNIQNLTIANPDDVALIVKNAQFSIQVVGHKAVATVVVKDIEDIIKKAESDFDRKKKQTKETLTNFKYYQLKLLLAQKYPSQMEQMFNGLKVKINLNKNEIVFEGLVEDIRTAQVATYEAVHNVVVSQLKERPEGSLYLYKSMGTEDYIVAKLKNKKLFAVWEVDGTNLNIYANSDDALKQSTCIIDDSVKEHQRVLESNQICVIQSQQWIDKIKDLDKQYQGKFKIILAQDFSKLFIYFTDDISYIVIKEVDHFLSQNKIHKELITCNRSTFQLIERRTKDELDKIGKDLAHSYVQIITESDKGFLILGTQDGISEAKLRLQKLFGSIKHREHKLQKPGISMYMQSKGKEHITTVENQVPCVIQIRGQEQSGLRENEEKADSCGVVNIGEPGPVTQVECRSFGGEKIFTVLGDITDIEADVLVNAADPKLEHCKGHAKAIVDKALPSINSGSENIIIKVVKGEMANQNVDVIVSTVSKSLDLTHGAVSQSLLRKGGQSLQDECMEIYPSGINLGDIAITGGGNLSCRKVCHMALVAWNDPAASKKMLRELMKKCLDECEKSGFTSIAFPALGTGNLNYPRDIVAKEMFQYISTYSSFHPFSSVTEVRFVVFQKDLQTIQAFELEQQKWRSNWSRGGTQTGPYSLQPEFSEESSVLPSMSFNNKSAASFGFGNISIKVVKGEMASQRVDVIVSPVANSLNLNHGAVSQSLLIKAGQTLQDECKKRYPNGIKDGDIAVTEGGNLSCKIVCHVALVQWKDETTSKKMLHGLMKKCLDECEKAGRTSIAFPALGTGNLNYPRDFVAKEMFQYISTYSRDYPSSPVTEVRFVVYHKDLPTVQAFKSEKQKWDSSGTRAGTWTSQHIPPDELSSFSTQPDDITFGRIHVKIYEGDITMVETDCIVNSSDGDVSKAIMKKGGRLLEDEYSTRADDIKHDGIAVTKGHGLNCKHIIHISAEYSETWIEVIQKCLLKGDQLKAKSVALPALGTNVRLSSEKIAIKMFKAITHFEHYAAKTVTEVHIVIFQSQMVQDFVKAARNFCSGIKPKSGRERTYTIVKAPGACDEQDPGKSLQTRRPIKLTHTVWIDVYALEIQSLDAAVNKLDDLIKNDFTETEFTESVVKKFSTDQISKLHRLAQEWDIQLTVDQTIGRITIEGVADRIMTVSNGIHKLIREADKNIQDKNSAELLKKLVQWHYIVITTESSELREYPADVNLIIETAYKDNKPFVTLFTNDGEECKIDFSKMEEFSVKDPSDTLTVVRKDLIEDLSSFEFPVTWSKMAPNENLKVVKLQITEREYQEVQQMFLQSVGGGNRTIRKLERIQNRTLYHQYEAKKKLIEQNNPGHQNEYKLWHGTSEDSVDSISMHGFNRSYCGRNATAFGDGVYFAKNASYSANDTYSKPDPSGNKRMYLCRVLTGHYTIGSKGIRVPPSKSANNASDLYNSVVNNTSNPEIFVIFNDTQAIPEYLITFA